MIGKIRSHDYMIKESMVSELSVVASMDSDYHALWMAQMQKAHH
jgi:hypothetical protein